MGTLGICNIGGSLINPLDASPILQNVFLLLVLFQVKHFLADYPLQFPYMLRKFRPGWDFFVPLTAHCVVHGFFTLAICLWWNPSLWWLAVVDFAAHFLMDRIKSGPRYLGRYNNMAKTAYWVTFGIDQMVHHLTGLYVIWVLITQTP